MWSTGELIVAQATATGPGCRSVVRLSGEGVDLLLRTLFEPVGEGFAVAGGPPRLVAATFSSRGLAIEWGAVPVEILHWPGPQGPTGGPLAEVQLPASAPLADAVVAEACRRGARLARGGEFTLRSFLAGRLDLVQAEAVLSVVEATGPEELSAALDALAGGMGGRLRQLRESLLDLAADVEAAIDFADEATPDAVPAADAAARAAIAGRLEEAGAAIALLVDGLAARDAAASGEVPRAVLAGPPNVGKSSLFNRLVGRDAALVADEPGTTRDWIAVRLDGGPGEPACLLVDVAGTTGDEPSGGDVDRMADARARDEIARAAVVVVCRDASADRNRPPTGGPPPGTAVRIDVLTRCDLGGPEGDDAGTIRTSSRSGQGIAEVRAAILRAVASLPGGRRTPATLRLRAGLSAADTAIAAARSEFGGTLGPGGRPAGDEAVAAMLVRRAAAAIGEVTGAEIGPDLIDRIFSRHCIGK